MDVTVVVATFGTRDWAELAHARAIPSAARFDVPIVHVHGNTLHEARNAGLNKVTTEWVCHLDADDELEPKYFERIATARGDLRVPSVRYMKNGFDQGVRMPKVAGHDHDCVDACLADGNWLVVGTVARTDIVRGVGGWREFPIYEDYDLWLRCWQAGASIEAVPPAVYRAHVRDDSRNRGPSQRVKRSTHRAIARANRIPIPAGL